MSKHNKHEVLDREYTKKEELPSLDDIEEAIEGEEIQKILDRELIRERRAERAAISYHYSDEEDYMDMMTANSIFGHLR